METQSGARPALVDPFGRELEAWLRDTPAVHAPYVPDLVVPPVTGAVVLPDTVPAEAGSVVSGSDPEADEAEPAPADGAEPAPSDAAVADEVASTDEVASLAVAPTGDTVAFRRDRGRHASVCAPAFPEPPARMSLRIGDLAVEVSSATGRSTVERITILEQELLRRGEDLARLAAWEARVARSDDPEIAAARAWAADAFADLLAGVAPERTARRVDTAPAVRRHEDAVVDAARSTQVGGGATVAETDSDTLAAVRRTTGVPEPVAAVTRPTPLVPPATGPNAIDHEAFVAALRAHTEAEAPAPFPLAPVGSSSVEAAPAALDLETNADATVSTDPRTDDTRAERTPSWWTRLLASVVRVLRRR